MKEHLTFNQVLRKLKFKLTYADSNYIHFKSRKYGEARAIKIDKRIICVTIGQRTFIKPCEIISQIENNKHGV